MFQVILISVLLGVFVLLATNYFEVKSIKSTLTSVDQQRLASRRCHENIFRVKFNAVFHSIRALPIPDGERYTEGPQKFHIAQIQWVAKLIQRSRDAAMSHFVFAPRTPNGENLLYVKALEDFIVESDELLDAIDAMIQLIELTSPIEDRINNTTTVAEHVEKFRTIGNRACTMFSCQCIDV